MPEIDPRLKHLKFQRRDGMMGQIVKLFDEAGRKTYDAKQAMIAIVHFEQEQDPQRREILARIVPDFCPYTSETVH